MLLVAVVVALLALVLLAVARVQGDLSPALRAQIAEAEQERVVHGVAARVAFLLLTEPIGPRSIVVGGVAGAASAEAGTLNAARVRIREVRLDGRYYAANGRDDVFVSVQDENGLLDLNAGDDASLAGLLEQVGAQLPTARRLAASLGDYVDGDDLTRLHGAERDAYRRARQPEPLNRNMVNRWSAAAALGWGSELSQQQRGELWRATTASAAPSAVNINTAPLAVLQAVLGDARLAHSIVERREVQELRALDEVEALTGTRAAGVVLAIQAGSAFRLVVAFEAPNASRWESQLVVAGPEADRPIYWREALREGGGFGRDREENTEILPESAALRAP
jgi:hypothetical protein